MTRLPAYSSCWLKGRAELLLTHCWHSPVSIFIGRVLIEADDQHVLFVIVIEKSMKICFAHTFYVTAPTSSGI